MPENQLAKAIGEVREWLIKIDTNQKNQMELLKEIKSTAHHASIKADDAEDAANAALQLAQQNKKDFERYQKRQDAEKKWTIKTGLTIIGFIVTLTAAMVPIFFSFYF